MLVFSLSVGISLTAVRQLIFRLNILNTLALSVGGSLTGIKAVLDSTY